MAIVKSRLLFFHDLWHNHPMIVVIIAGGSGTRLWPLSTPTYPKHLLALTDDKSLLQHTYERAQRISDAEKIYVVTEASHSDEVAKQLPNLPDRNIIVEPGRRGTGGCLVAGLERIVSHNRNGDPIIFMHADHQIRDIDSFTNVVKYAGKIAKSEHKITLLGVEPTYPAAFGYIHKGKQLQGEGEEFVYEVQSFKEKPAQDVAREYQASGEYLWNMGYFVATTETFLEKMKTYAPGLYKNYQKLRATNGDADAYRQTYLGFENLVIDYALMETTPDLLVVPGTFDWIDIGSFNDLPDVVELNEQGNHFRGEAIETIDVENSYIRNDEDKVVAVIGLDNVVVVNTPNGVLVTRRDLAQRVGEVAKKIQAKSDSDKS
jgi:mannose-1-phosphate guanylyltransferase/mannose-6-phosphate isomerase